MTLDEGIFEWVGKRIEMRLFLCGILGVLIGGFIFNIHGAYASHLGEPFKKDMAFLNEERLSSTRGVNVLPAVAVHALYQTVVGGLRLNGSRLLGVALGGLLEFRLPVDHETSFATLLELYDTHQVFNELVRRAVFENWMLSLIGEMYEFSSLFQEDAETIDHSLLRLYVLSFINLSMSLDSQFDIDGKWVSSKIDELFLDLDEVDIVDIQAIKTLLVSQRSQSILGSKTSEQWAKAIFGEYFDDLNQMDNDPQTKCNIQESLKRYQSKYFFEKLPASGAVGSEMWMELTRKPIPNGTKFPKMKPGGSVRCVLHIEFNHSSASITFKHPLAGPSSNSIIDKVSLEQFNALSSFNWDSKQEIKRKFDRMTFSSTKDCRRLSDPNIDYCREASKMDVPRSIRTLVD